MLIRIPYLLFVVTVLVTLSVSMPVDLLYEPVEFEGHEDYYYPVGEVQEVRVRRSPHPETEEEKRKREQGWHVKPNAGGDGKNTNAGVEVKRVGEKHDFEAGWNKVVHGPGRAKPTWHVGGSFRF